MENAAEKTTSISSPFVEALKSQNKIFLIFFGAFSLYFLYGLYNNPLIYYSIKGLSLVVPYITDLVIMVLKYFLPLFIIQFAICKFSKNILIRKFSWVITFLLINYLNSMGLFGTFSMMPTEIYYWLLAQIKLLMFYYIILLLFLPVIFWDKAQQTFTFIISIAMCAVPIPMVSTMVVSSSIVVFFILNLIGFLMLKLEDVV